MLRIYKKIGLILSTVLLLAMPVGGLAAAEPSSYSAGSAATVTSSQSATPSMNLSARGQQVAQLAPADSPQLAAVSLGAVDQTITPKMGLFNDQQNIVASQEQLPEQFTPGIIQYDGTNDHSAKIADQLTTDQMKELNDYSNRWMNSLRHTWQSNPDKYRYRGQVYQAPNDLMTPPALFDAVSELAADRTRVNYGYDHTGDERIILNNNGDTSYGQYVQRAGLTPPESLVTRIAPTATGTSYQVGENLFKLSGRKMLEAEVNLFNRMQDMLWGEATTVNGKLEGANEHLANVLNPIFTHVAMGFQKVSPNHWYVLWVFDGLSNRNPFTGQQYFSDEERVAINRQWDAILAGKTKVVEENKGGQTTSNTITQSNHCLILIGNKSGGVRQLVTPSLTSNKHPNWDKNRANEVAKIKMNVINVPTQVIFQQERKNNSQLPATGNEQSQLVLGFFLVILLFPLAWLLKK